MADVCWCVNKMWSSSISLIGIRMEVWWWRRTKVMLIVIVVNFTLTNIINVVDCITSVVCNFLSSGANVICCIFNTVQPVLDALFPWTTSLNVVSKLIFYVVNDFILSILFSFNRTKLVWNVLELVSNVLKAMDTGIILMPYHLKSVSKMLNRPMIHNNKPNHNSN